MAEDPTQKRRSRWGQVPEGQLAIPEPLPLAGFMMPNPMHGAFDLPAAAKAAREALEKAKKAAQVQRQIQEQMLHLKAQGMGVAGMANAQFFAGHDEPKPRKLILDEFGRELDEDGHVVPMRGPVQSVLMVNQKRDEEEEERLKVAKERNISRFIDPSLRKGPERSDRTKKKGFKFVEEGTYTRVEYRMAKRDQERKMGINVGKMEAERRDAEKKSAKANEGLNPNLVELGARRDTSHIKRRDPVPEVEFWDSLLLRETAPGQDWFLDEGKITLYIEHPVPIKAMEKEQTFREMHLTEKERKRLRRLRKQQRNKELQDKIKMGIVAPPPPKVKMSNLMRVLGDEQVADPSMIEKRVKDVVESRKRGHEDRNKSRKLDEKTKKAKKIAKWCEDTSLSTNVQVYKMTREPSKKIQYKIDQNAQQFHVTGLLVVSPNSSIVVIEGGPRSSKRFKKLMLRRMKWDEDRVEESDGSDDEGLVNNEDCCLLWEGVVRHRNFKTWKAVTAKSDNEARKAFSDRNAEHYFEMLTRHRDAKMDM